MCGRLVTPRRSKIIATFNINSIGKYAPIAPENSEHTPGEIIPVVVTKDSKRILTGMRWGFGDVYNTRVESLEKPFWKDDYETHRAIFPIHEFFERRWFSGAEVLAGAAIWRYQRYGKQHIREVSLLTKPSTGTVKNHHPRMPLIIPHSMIDQWMSTELDAQDCISEEEEEIDYS